MRWKECQYEEYIWNSSKNDWSYKEKFEGDCLNGKRWNGTLSNEIEYILIKIGNGNGYLKEYDKYEKLIFEGEYLNGERNGRGKVNYY